MSTRSVKHPTKAERKRRRAAAAKAAEQARRRARNIRLGLTAAAAAAVIAVGVAVFASGGKHSTTSSPPPVATGATTAGSARSDPPPWPAPANASAAVASAGLPMLAEEGNALHIHVHLDVIVNGKPVTVPAGIGIDESSQRISPLHTHDPSGVIHIESPTRTDFTLGQLFAEWQVSLSARNIGALTADNDHELTAYVNGQPRPGNPADIVLKAHDEIALVYGPPDQPDKVPSSYQFPAGE